MQYEVVNSTCWLARFTELQYSNMAICSKCRTCFDSNLRRCPKCNSVYHPEVKINWSFIVNFSFFFFLVVGDRTSCISDRAPSVYK